MADRNMFLIKEEDKTSENEPNKMEINNLPGKGFKVMVIKIINELGRRMKNTV